MLKVAFHTMGQGEWPAGEVYLKNLFSALRRALRSEIRLYLMAPHGWQGADKYASSIEADDVIHYSAAVRRRSPAGMFNELVKRLSLRDLVMERLFRRNGIDAVFNSLQINRYSRVATLYWIPDFQHMHLPEMFSKAECVSRNRIFLHCAKVSTRVILMSEAVKKDFERFAPEYAHKARALHPISCISESVYNSDLSSLLSLYSLPEKFVYLPNQFWKHKNHETAFEAVKILKDRGIDVSLVCTGNTADYRQPTHFAELCRKISEWNIRDRIIYLGLIPREHVLLLMRQSVCILNPSLFEGWGYSADEARSIGKQSLLSDLPSHREQNPPKAAFFNPRDCEELAEKLGRIWLDSDPGPDIELESEARLSLPARLSVYGEAFASVLQDSVREAG